MLTARYLRTPTKVDPLEVRAALLRLAESGWKPVVAEAQRAAALLAGCDDSVAANLVQTRRGTEVADVIFAGDVLYYALSSAADAPFIEVGVVTNAGVDGDLEKFASFLERAIIGALDGRKARHMKFEWSEPRLRSKKLEAIRNSAREEGAIAFEVASLENSDVVAAEILKSRLSRVTLVEIAQAGFVREPDLLARRGKARDDLKGAVDELKAGGLVAVEYLLECRKTSAALTRLQAAADLNHDSVARLRCPACARPFAEELLSEGYTVSDRGRRLLNKSYWMTVWVTARLVASGVPIESILWNLSEYGEEIDLVADVLGDLWLFELKDREFGAGDAHAFNYRRVRYKSDKGIIVTTEKVSTDARRVFQDVSQERRGGQTLPTFVEGLENAEAILGGEIEASHKRQIGRRLVRVSDASGLNLRPLIKPLVGDLPDPRRTIYDELVVSPGIYWESSEEAGA